MALACALVQRRAAFAFRPPRCVTLVTESDAGRLATRMRLEEGWQAALNIDVLSAHAALIESGRLKPNAAQSKAVAALSQLPAALSKAREARQTWDAEQARWTSRAQHSAMASADRRAKAAAWQRSWLSGSPDAPSTPNIVGSVCWLQLGPPPAMKPAGCYIHGSVGSGKSTIMDLFCLAGLQGWRTRRQHFHEFSLWLHQELRRLASPGSNEPQKHVLERVADGATKGVDVICLDEFAVTNVADAAMIGRLLRLFAERHVAIICTTNRPPEDLYKDGLHRERYVPALVEHLRGTYLVAEVGGADYREALRREESRQPQAQAAPTVFFCGGCPEAAMVQALADEGSLILSPGEVPVTWGRNLRVPGLGAGIARFHFNDLCRSALAAEDFLLLAGRFHTVFVHDVPQLALEEHNEARRFTNLVDALYEHSVRLLCHSHVEIDGVLRSIEALQAASTNSEHDAEQLGVFETMYDDSPNFQIQIKELGSREKWQELQDRRIAEEQRAEARRLGRLMAPAAVEGDTGSGWSAAPAGADLSSPDQGVAGVMVAAVGSLQESGFAAKRAASRLKEMQTKAYLDAARKRRASQDW